MRARRGFVIFAVTLLAACGFDPTVGQPILDCDSAREYAEPAMRPPELPREGPLQAGEVVPIYELSLPRWNATELAARTVMVACTFDEDVVSTPELYAWAQESVRTGERVDRIEPFENADLSVDYDPADDDLEVRDRSIPMHSVPEDLQPGELDEGIGEDAARAVAQQRVMELESAGLLSPAAFDGEAHFTRVVSSSPEGNWVKSYSAWFAIRRGEMAIGPAYMKVDLNSDGEVYEVEVHDLHVEQLAEATVALDEAEAELLLHEGALEYGPDDATLDNSELYNPWVGYLRDDELGTEIAKPRIHGTASFSAGLTPWVIGVSLSMLDPDAGVTHDYSHH